MIQMEKTENTKCWENMELELPHTLLQDYHFGKLALSKV